MVSGLPAQPSPKTLNPEFRSQKARRSSLLVAEQAGRIVHGFRASEWKIGCLFQGFRDSCLTTRKVCFPLRDLCVLL
jgi:hypothetical protein